MKRFLVMFLILGLLVGSVATAAPKKKPKRTARTAEGSYDTPVVGPMGFCAESDGVGCVSFSTKSKERFVTAKAVDAHGLPVFVLIREVGSGQPLQGATTYGTFCGETSEPIAVPPNQDLQFWVGAAASAPNCQPGIATSGTITATFSNRP